MFDGLRNLFGGRQPTTPGRSRMVSDHWPAALYAIGDVHGCLRQLRELEQKIQADAAGVEGEKWIVQLGDLVDRGPDSAGVLEYVMARPSGGFRRICLAGNHEEMFGNFFASPSRRSSWLDFGGHETLESYGIDPLALRETTPHRTRTILDSHVPSEHIAFLAGLPVMVELPGMVLVHAGLRPGISLDRQADEDLMWIREPFLTAEFAEYRVVHGHTPGREPVVTPSRICLDTGAFATGTLTAARLTATECTLFSV